MDTTVRVWAATRRPGRCRGCGARLDWYDTMRGARIPIAGGALPARLEQIPAAAPGRRVVYLFDRGEVHIATCARAERFTPAARARGGAR